MPATPSPARPQPRSVARLWVRIALTSALFLSATTVASAQEPAEAASDDQEARMRFELGQRYYEQGRFAEAAVEFTRAYDASARDALLYNMFIAHRDAGDDAQAADALRRYLATSEPTGDRRSNLEARLATLERRIAASEAGQPPPDEPPPPRSESPLPLVGGIVLAVGGALVISAIPVGVIALDSEARLVAACPGDVCDPSQQGLIDETQTLGIVTDVLWVSGAVVAAAGASLLLVGLLTGGDDAERDELVALRPGLGCGGDGCVASLEGSFR